MEFYDKIKTEKGTLGIERLKVAHLKTADTNVDLGLYKDFVVSLILSCVWLNDERITYEELLDLDVEDYIQLLEHMDAQTQPLTRYM